MTEPRLSATTCVALKVRRPVEEARVVVNPTLSHYCPLGGLNV